jgi:hypothetical protein
MTTHKDGPSHVLKEQSAKLKIRTTEEHRSPRAVQVLRCSPRQRSGCSDRSAIVRKSGSQDPLATVVSLQSTSYAIQSRRCVCCEWNERRDTTSIGRSMAATSRFSQLQCDCRTQIKQVRPQTWRLHAHGDSSSANLSIKVATIKFGRGCQARKTMATASALVKVDFFSWMQTYPEPPDSDGEVRFKDELQPRYPRGSTERKNLAPTGNDRS